MELLRSAASGPSGRRLADPTPSSCGRQLSSQDGQDARSGHASQQPAGTGRDHVAQRSSISPPRCQARGLAGDTGGAPTSRWPVAASPPDFRRRASHVLPGARWLGFQPANRGDQAQPLGLPGCAGCPGPDGAISTGARCLAASAAGPCIARETGRSSSRVAPAVSASPLAERHVSSKMIIGVRVPGSGCHLHMSAGRVPGRDGHCRAGQGRSGYAERKDSGNDENSPDTHDSSLRFPRSAACCTALPACTAYLPSCEVISQEAVILCALDNLFLVY